MTKAISSAWCLVAGLALASACAPPAPAGPRTVVLVVLDSVRADHVGAYGYARATTPCLDRLAAAGLLFERAYAASSSGPQSLAALWTGRLPSSSGSIGLDEAAPPESLPTLPRSFLRAGFRTGLVSSHPALCRRGFTRGFDDVEIDSTPGRWSGELVTEKALAIADEAGERPLFLVVDYADAAEPHAPPPGFRRRIEVPPAQEPLTGGKLRAAAGALPAGIEQSRGFLDLVARYDAEIAHVDDCLGKLIGGLDERGRLAEALLIVTSSHGTEFLEHGYVGHGWTLHDEVLRVPLVVHAPRFLAAGRESSLVSLVDVFPTLRAVAGFAGPEPLLDGAPFLARGEHGLRACAARDALVGELVTPELCILRTSIRAGWKRIDVIKDARPEARLGLLASYDRIVRRVQAGELPRPDPWGRPERVELYDLTRDPREESDVSASYPDELERLGAFLARYRESCERSGLEALAPAPAAELPEPGALEELQQVGYL